MAWCFLLPAARCRRRCHACWPLPLARPPRKLFDIRYGWGHAFGRPGRKPASFTRCCRPLPPPAAAFVLPAAAAVPPPAGCPLAVASGCHTAAASRSSHCWAVSTPQAGAARPSARNCNETTAFYRIKLCVHLLCLIKHHHWLTFAAAGLPSPLAVSTTRHAGNHVEQTETTTPTSDSRWLS